jgi:hypothetical protein
MTCKDLPYTGEECCDSCHRVEEGRYLRDIKVDGEWYTVCCAMERFFYPEETKNLTPEEKLLRAIFNEDHWKAEEQPHR